jgi:DNA-binding MarR family transcriptional regulator
MNRTGTGHKYRLAEDIRTDTVKREERKPGEYGLIYYLKLREIEGRDGATQSEMVDDSGMSVKTVQRAVKQLREKGVIQ